MAERQGLDCCCIFLGNTIFAALVMTSNKKENLPEFYDWTARKK